MTPVDYAPILVMIALASVVAVVFVLGSVFLGPSHKNARKQAPFECGHPSDGAPRNRFSVKFYSIAILIILFDVESVFLYPWAVAYGGLGLFALVEMVLFLGILIIALAYAWGKGGLEWD